MTTAENPCRAHPEGSPRTPLQDTGADGLAHRRRNPSCTELGVLGVPIEKLRERWPFRALGIQSSSRRQRTVRPRCFRGLLAATTTTTNAGRRMPHQPTIAALPLS